MSRFFWRRGVFWVLAVVTMSEVSLMHLSLVTFPVGFPYLSSQNLPCVALWKLVEEIDARWSLVTGQPFLKEFDQLFLIRCHPRLKNHSSLRLAS